MNAKNLSAEAPSSKTINSAIEAVLEIADILRYIADRAARLPIDAEMGCADQAAGFATCLSTLPSGSIKASLDANGIHGAAAAATSTPLDADLHPVDSELILEIRAMFLTHWGMNSTQTDARMVHFNYGQCRRGTACSLCLAPSVAPFAAAPTLASFAASTARQISIWCCSTVRQNGYLGGSWQLGCIAGLRTSNPRRAAPVAGQSSQPVQARLVLVWRAVRPFLFYRVVIRISTMATRPPTTGRTKAAPAPSADFQFNPLSISA